MRPTNLAYKAILCQVVLQRRAGGNDNIGRELYPILNQVGFCSIHVSPRIVYVDSSKPSLVEGFTKNAFTAMIKDVRESSIEAGLIDAKTFDDGINGSCRATEADGVFCYTFFKAVAKKKFHLIFDHGLKYIFNQFWHLYHCTGH